MVVEIIRVNESTSIFQAIDAATGSASVTTSCGGTNNCAGEDKCFDNAFHNVISYHFI